ncbi:hypothetical protein BO85DRAFT_483345 [Aspergillus piperis CBS 112811]|uniref:Uncharacterized protein n=1 Tax=Aspergillus piperis CBS 112811 TaxID=1448313 RepID=A0A8G1VV52_9EURO|nr:hypothetical protein BO85DRAFT_483345 [Aspergillus piperis CBS 112811]RAH63503.1 hypothetical protein BO85DRAFT_483345 [Aspergillus piperis CBS 112811]
MSSTFCREVDSLLSLSSVNGLFRQLCAAHIFRTLKIAFSSAGLDRLVQISQSRVTSHVRAIVYEIPERIPPNNESYDYFQTHIYTPADARAREQRIVHENAQDTEALMIALPCFPRLETVHLSFIDDIKSPFRWFAGRVFLDGVSCLKDHLVKMSAAMVVAKMEGVVVKTFEISGFHSRVNTRDSLVLYLLEKALSNVEELRAINSPTILEPLSQIMLPSVRRFELGYGWLSLETIDSFVRQHANSLRFLYLKTPGSCTKDSVRTVSILSMANAQHILKNMAGVWDTDILEEITINTRPGGV